MTIENYAAKYIPESVPGNLPRYERDGLLIYIDQLKYKRFCEDRD